MTPLISLRTSPFLMSFLSLLFIASVFVYRCHLRPCSISGRDITLAISFYDLGRCNNIPLFFSEPLVTEKRRWIIGS